MRLSCLTGLALCLPSCVAQITRTECVEQGGEVVGDIGNGAIFSPNYLCEINGLPPTSTVQAGPGENIASEGEVCCGGSESGSPPLEFNGGRAEYTRQECMDLNGNIVGDIGNGAIFRGDYVCASNGLPPIGNIVQQEPPFAIEGEVCCGEELRSSGITREECTDADGIIVGDIGNGAIFQDDYVCESNGLPPIANIVQEGPQFAIEGEVCCGSEVVGRDSITRQECLDQGGEVIGDIGDGSIMADDFVCESNGEPPIANVVPVEGEPIAIEGEVCCGTQQGEQDGDPDSGAFLRPIAFFVFLVKLIYALFS